MININYSKLRILVVEDDTFTRQLIRKVLKDIGVRFVAESANGKEGLLELIRTRPDIVFCDIHMTPIDGRQFLREVRGTRVKGINQIPIVFLTADSEAATVRFALEHHINGYLLKPISLTKLRDSINAVVAADEDIRERYGFK